MRDLPGRALVLGLARSGRAAALALRRHGVHVRAVDDSDLVDAGELAAAGAEVFLGTGDHSLLDGVGLLVKSPGVPGEAPLVEAARRAGVPIWSEIELGYRLLDAPLVGVTGTNGKTTTAELLGAMFRAGGVSTEVAGNVGAPLTGLDGRVSKTTWVVCELSSFQLEDIEAFRPRIAVLLNLEPDHLDRHGSFERYREAKLRIFENQESGDAAVVPPEFGELPGEARRVEFAAADPLPAEPLIPGAHNRENAVAAAAAAREAGVEKEAIAEALRSFPGVPHRLEPVGEIDGVRFFNDSKATNTAAALRGLAAFEESLHVILGGSLKGESFDPLARALAGRGARAYLIGEAADLLETALAAANVDHEHCGELGRAVEAAAARARPGEIVLLSPACASFDQFRDFEERGDAFRELVARLMRRGR